MLNESAVDILGTRGSFGLPSARIRVAVPHVHPVHGDSDSALHRLLERPVGVLSAASDGIEHGLANSGDVPSVVPEYNHGTICPRYHIDALSVPLRVRRNMEKDELACMK
jgi:hypothetical protein